MSKPILFSKVFMKSHSKAGQQTFFKEKILSGLIYFKKCPRSIAHADNVFDARGNLKFFPKVTTIRAGHRWKVGDTFSPREWIDKPYRSKQRSFYQELKIVKIYNFRYEPMNGYFLNDYSIDISKTYIPQNDGLTIEDFKEWFETEKRFDGQIISWIENVNYEKVYSENSPALLDPDPFPF